MNNYYQVAVYHRNLHGGTGVPRITNYKTPDEVTAAVLSANQERYTFAVRVFQVREVSWPGTWDSATRRRSLSSFFKRFLARVVVGVVGKVLIWTTPSEKLNKRLSERQTAKNCS